MPLINVSPNILYDQSIIEKSKSLQQRMAGKFPNVRENVLKKSVSYTPIFSIGTLTEAQVSSQQYSSATRWMVLGEGGYVGTKDPYGRGERVATAYGRPEYYLNNFEMTSYGGPTPQTGSQTIAMFKMEVFEPYSMGLFLQSLQRAALEAGWKNYLGAVFILKIDFIGWNTAGVSGLFAGTSSSGISSSGLLAQRYFPFKLKMAKFKTNESGTVYQVEAFPPGLTAATDNVKVLTQSASLTGSTVGEVLKTGEKSLEKHLANRQNIVKDQGQEQYPDEYVINFTDGRSESSVISSSEFEEKDRETPRFTTVRVAQDTAQNDAIKSPGITFSFPRGENAADSHDIIKIIEEVVLNSKYCIENLKKPDSDGFVNWFKVNLEVRYPGKFDTARNSEQKTYVYWVSEYKVHQSVLIAPGQAGADTTALCKKVIKKYDFYYTGQNDDVIKWDLDFDLSFYQAALATPAEETDAVDPSKKASTDAVEVYRTKVGDNFDQLARVTGAARIFRSQEAYNSPGAGAGIDTQSIRIAKTFQEALKQANDRNMLKIDLEIVGDPYWLAYTGVRSRDSVPTETGSMINQDGTMAVDSTEICIFVGFRTPIDAPARGSLFEFPNSYSPYSGVYKIIKVVNVIKDGIFTQRLTGFRMMTQSKDDAVINSLTSDPDLFLYEDAGKAQEPKNEVEKSGASTAPVASQPSSQQNPLPPAAGER